MLVRLAMATLFFTTTLFAQTAPDPQIDRIYRYIDLKMYPEAKTAAEAALKDKEFDGETRYLYGLSLHGLGDFTEAIRQLEIARKLDASDNRFIEALAKVYGTKLQKALLTNEERVAATSTVALWKLSSTTELALIELAKLNGDPNGQQQSKIATLTKAKETAHALWDALVSPVGNWKVGGSSYKIQFQNGDLWFSEVGPSPYVVQILKVTDTEFKGSGLISIGGCLFDGDVFITMDRPSTQLEVRTVARNPRGFNVAALSANEWTESMIRTAREFCQTYAQKNGLPTNKEALSRVP